MNSNLPVNLSRALGGCLAALVIVCAAAPAAQAATLRVGKDKTYVTPSLAAVAAHDGDTIEIDAGTYGGDVTAWRANNLTIRGVGGKAILDAQGKAFERKAIWVIKGDDTLVENVEFTGAVVSDKNGAGIRQEGRNLTLRHCSFHDNEDGILAGDSPDSVILIEFCEFNHNGHGDGQSHNMYINHVARFTLLGCYSHNAHVGHDVKSRALVNNILYNRITDDDTSNTSYDLDLPNGGLCTITGNVIRKGPHAENGTVLSFAEEGATNPQQALYVVNNTFVNDRHAGTFIRAAGKPILRVINNLFLGPGDEVSGATGALTHNLSATARDFKDVAAHDYHLADGSAAIDAGMDPVKIDVPGATPPAQLDLTPTFQYHDPAGFEPRPVRGVLDVGAYEWVGKGDK